MEVGSVVRRQRLDVLALNGSVVPMGQEFSVAASRKTYDDHHSRAKQYAADHTCHVWCVDFMTCSGKPDDFQERPVSPTPAAVTRAGSKVHFRFCRNYGPLPISGPFDSMQLSLLAHILVIRDRLCSLFSLPSVHQAVRARFTLSH